MIFGIGFKQQLQANVIEKVYLHFISIHVMVFDLEHSLRRKEKTLEHVWSKINHKNIYVAIYYLIKGKMGILKLKSLINIERYHSFGTN